MSAGKGKTGQGSSALLFCLHARNNNLDPGLRCEAQGAAVRWLGVKGRMSWEGFSRDRGEGKGKREKEWKSGY